MNIIKDETQIDNDGGVVVDLEDYSLEEQSEFWYNMIIRFTKSKSKTKNKLIFPNKKQ